MLKHIVRRMLIKTFVGFYTRGNCATNWNQCQNEVEKVEDLKRAEEVSYCSVGAKCQQSKKKEVKVTVTQVKVIERNISCGKS